MIRAVQTYASSINTFSNNYKKNQVPNFGSTFGGFELNADTDIFLKQLDNRYPQLSTFLYEKLPYIVTAALKEDGKHSNFTFFINNVIKSGDNLPTLRGDLLMDDKRIPSLGPVLIKPLEKAETANSPDTYNYDIDQFVKVIHRAS